MTKAQAYSRIKSAYLRVLAAILIPCAAAGLFGCAQAREYPGPMPDSTATPPPVTVDEPFAFEADLYFYFSDNSQRNDLRVEKRMLTLQPGESYAEAALRALAQGPESGELMPVLPSTLTFEGVELTGSVCNVYFAGSLPERSGPIDYPLVLRAAVAATVQSNQALSAAEQGTQSMWRVDIFVNGVQQGYARQPIGLLAPIEVALDTYTADIWQEYGLSGTSSREDIGYLEHEVALYFADTPRQLLLASVGTVNYSKGATGPQVVEKLVAELMKGPLSGDGREWLIPANLRLRRSVLLPLTPPDTADGRAAGQEDEGETPAREALMGEPCVAALYFEGPDTITDAQLVYASLVYTITGFIPNVEGLLIYVNGTLMNASIGGESEGAAHMDHAYTREDFKELIGQLVRVFLPERGGRGLYTISRSLPSGSIYSATARVRALFEGPADPGVRLDYFESADVLSVTRRGNMIVVNFRAGFREKLEDFIVASSILPYDTRIRMFVFSLVNTLCVLPGIQQVWMLEDGARIDASLGMIYLGGPLYYNPGLVLSETTLQ